MANSDRTRSAFTAGRQIAGWCSDLHSPHLHTEATVVVGPEATSAGLLAWGIGQLQQLNILLTVIGCAQHTSPADPGELCGAIRHQLEQAMATIEAAADQLAEDARTAEAAS